MKKIVTVCLGIFILSGLFGCAELNLFFKNYQLNNQYTNPEFRRFKIHDIGIVPLKNESASRKNIADGITQQLVIELNKRGWYALHMISEEDLATPEKLSNIDAVMIGSIIDYRDVEPLKFGIKLTLMDINTKETIWSAQEIFDGSNNLVAKNLETYYSYQVDKRNPLMGSKLYLVSINKFVEYGLFKVTETIDAAIKQKFIDDKKEQEALKKAAMVEEYKAKAAEREERVRLREKKVREDRKELDSATLILGGEK
jgi:hypothetical protein